MEHTGHSCCTPKQAQDHAVHHKPTAHKASSLSTAAHATVHCLTGCVIGEFIGLAIGVSLGLPPFATIALSTTLAYISGFSLTIIPLMKRAGLRFAGAFKAIWLGEVISIGVMEVVMNATDYHMGGMQSGSLAGPVFWQALAVAVVAGYIAAFPVNYWLIGKQMKKCH